MNSVKEESKVIPYQKKRNLNIGIIIFSIIFIYLVATIVMYLTAPHVTVYEVRQGSILKDNAYTGLAIRSESIVYADRDGYVNYYMENNSKIRVGTEVISLSGEQLIFEKNDANKEFSLTEEQLRQLILKIQNFNDNFSESDFESMYQLKQELGSSLDKYANQTKSEQLKDYMSKNPNADLTVKNAKYDGIVVYALDGMENVTLQTVTTDLLHRDSYKKKEFSNNTFVLDGDAVYKVVTDEKWQLLMEISEETKEALKGKSTVKVHFKKDNQTVRGKISYLENEPSVLCITFEHSMVRYVNERYLDVELILEDQSGLKIPKSAETQKKFYIVPQDYLTQGGNSSNEGVLLVTKDKEGASVVKFQAVTVYYKEDGYAYLDPNAFEKSAVLQKPDSGETYELKEMRSLRGVYCINKGYAVFKQIKVLCESDEYYIVEEGNQFGLSNYDHIALNSSSLRENDVVF